MSDDIFGGASCDGVEGMHYTYRAYMIGDGNLGHIPLFCTYLRRDTRNLKTSYSIQGSRSEETVTSTTPRWPE